MLAAAEQVPLSFTNNGRPRDCFVRVSTIEADRNEWTVRFLLRST